MDACYVIRTHPLMESSVSQRLGCCFVPTYEREIRSRHSIRVRRLPLFPTYIFVYWNFEDRGSHEIMRMHGVRQILGSPTPVADVVVDRLRQLDLSRMLDEGLRAGERVWLKDWECEGLLDSCEGERCRVLVTLLGRTFPRDCTRLQIERLQ